MCVYIQETITPVLSDYDWYYNKGNWKKLSEEKIKAYVTALGIDYKEPE